MRAHKYYPACLLIGLFFLIVGCGSFTPPAAWGLTWTPSDSAAQVNSSETAYLACARVQMPNGSLAMPAANMLLANGSQPRVALGLSQLDPAGQFWGLGILSIDGGANRWQLTESGSLARPTGGNGVPASQEEGNVWHLPAGMYNSLALAVPDTQPGGSAQLWLSDHQQEFVLARFYATMQPPAGYTSVTLAGQSGWLATQGRFTVIALRLSNGIYAGLGTLIFAGTTGIQQSEQLAAQAASDLNDILPA